MTISMTMLTAKYAHPNWLGSSYTRKTPARVP